MYSIQSYLSNKSKHVYTYLFNFSLFIPSITIQLHFGNISINNDGSSYHGFVNHCHGITEFYRIRRDAFVKSIDKHLKGLVKYSIPDAGMFCWLELIGVEDADLFIKEKAKNAKVLLVPGQSFDPLDRISSYARAAYSTASVEDMDVALERLGRLLREHNERK